ncbi:unnamed protein product, partial [Prorocentrum cordatum]
GRPAGDEQPSCEVGVDLLKLFPLPRLPDIRSRDGRPQSRGGGRLAGRARCDFSDAVGVLNWFANRQHTGVKPNFDQQRVHARILDIVADSTPPQETAIPSPRAAFNELLHGRSVYDESAGRNIGRLRNVGQIPLPIRPRRLYVRFIRLLRSKGVLVFPDESERREEVGVFYVAKKSDQFRMIVDARKSNLHFTSPPGVALVTAEGLARVAVGLDGSSMTGAAEGFTLGTSDISDAFHRFRIDRGLSGYFCTRPALAGEVGLAGTKLGGRRLEADARLVPACAALPMGFTWSRFFCQEVGESMMSDAPELAGVPRMSDWGPTTVLQPARPLDHGGGAQYTYVDDLGVLGFDAAAVAECLGATATRFNQAGLVTHETELQEGRGETLGCVLDGKALSTRRTAKRYWRVRQGLSWALWCRALPGWAWEVVIGHCTYCAMCYRDLLPAFTAVYKFIAANYSQGAALWASARAELVAFRGLMPLLRGDWALPWSKLACLSDASEHGCAVSASLFGEAEVKKIGRVQERSRFRRLGGHSARAHFFAMNGITMTLGGALKPVTELEEGDVVADDAEWGVNPAVEEMPAGIFMGARWIEIVARGWHNTTEDIYVYESRALLRAVEIQCSLSPSVGEHLVVMSDNLPAVLCSERRRAKNYVVLSCIRRAVALCLALNRWVTTTAVEQRIVGLLNMKRSIVEHTSIIIKHMSAMAQHMKRNIIEHMKQNIAEHMNRGGPWQLPPQAPRARHALMSQRQRRLRPDSVDGAPAPERPERRARRSRAMSPSALPPPLAPPPGAASVLQRRRSLVPPPGLAARLLRPPPIARAESGENDATTNPEDGKEASCPLVVDSVVDAAPVHYTNGLPEEKRGANRGDVLLSALLHFQPQYGKFGISRPPRAWRALKGLLTIQRRDLAKPVKGGVDEWFLILSPGSRGATRKNRAQDEGIRLANKLCPWLPRVASSLAPGTPVSRVSPHSHPELVAEPNRTRARLGHHSPVRYQGRHAGASVDLRGRHRDHPELMKRREWQYKSSPKWCENAVSSNLSVSMLMPTQAAQFKKTDAQLEALSFNRVAAQPFVPR